MDEPTRIGQRLLKRDFVVDRHVEFVLAKTYELVAAVEELPNGWVDRIPHSSSVPELQEEKR